MTNSLQKIVGDALVEKKFSACAIAVSRRGHEPVFSYYGKTTLDEYGTVTDASTLFDLASVTKVMFTTTVATELLDAKQIKLNVPISEHPGLEKISGLIRNQQYQACTFEDLLLHRAGFPGTVKYTRIKIPKQRNDPAEDQALSEKLIEFTTSIKSIYSCGQKMVYSDPGFILLAELFSQITKKSTSELWRGIQKRWNLTSTKSVNELTGDEKIARTGIDLKFGESQDQQARHLRKLCGHSGLFGTVGDVLSFGKQWLEAYKNGIPVLTQPSAKQCIDPYFKFDQYVRYLGWDGVSQNSTAGNISQKSIGHLGYTGTSLWIDLERDIVVALLTNRTLHDLKKSTDLLTPRQILEFNDFRRNIHNEVWRMGEE